MNKTIRARFYLSLFKPVFFSILLRLLHYMPSFFLEFNSRYRLSYANVALIGRQSQAKKIAINNVMFNFYRNLGKKIYPELNMKKLAQYASNVSYVVDETPNASVSFDTPGTLFILFHSGDYWIAIFKILMSYKTKSRFIFFRRAGNRIEEEEALRSLSRIGHTIDIIDGNGSKGLVYMIKKLKKGDNVIIFGDLPVNIGFVDYGQPTKGMLLGHIAYLCAGVNFIGQKSGANTVILSSYLDQSFKSYIKVFEMMPKQCDDLFRQIIYALDIFVNQHADSWYFFPVVETYFHTKKRK